MLLPTWQWDQVSSVFHLGSHEHLVELSTLRQACKNFAERTQHLIDNAYRQMLSVSRVRIVTALRNRYVLGRAARYLRDTR